jgi:glycerol uptake facilitator-like aquaporin
VTLCAPTSGGHFNPCVTIAQVAFRGFPARKAPFYILAQIFGAFVACFVVYLQYRDVILVRPLPSASRLLSLSRAC